MLNILIIDDEQPARDRLRRLVGAIPDCRVAGEAGNGSEALEKIRELSPDVLLLDISMPGMDGMALAKVLQQGGASPAVIFCTAYQDQALRAFEVEAVDYVVKPVRAERLEKRWKRPPAMSATANVTTRASTSCVPPWAARSYSPRSAA